MTESELNFDTLALHGGYTPDAEAHATSVPIYQTTSYVYDSADDAASQLRLRSQANFIRALPIRRQRSLKIDWRC